MLGRKKVERKLADMLKILWERGFFAEERAFNDIKQELSQELGCNPSSQNLQMALKRARSYLTRKGPRLKYKYIQKYRTKNITLNDKILPDSLIKTLGNDFRTEIIDLKLNFGKSGTCTAFLLRKILEKLIFVAFAKNCLVDRLKDKDGEFVNLSKMLNLATNTKIKGTIFLILKTAKNIAGIKFLGDTAAHNYLVNVDMATIMPVMPFIITAYQELSRKI
jgi:hypothetical protein